MAQEVPRMPKEELKDKLDDPQVEVIDVRQPKDKEQSAEKVQGARLENPNEMGCFGGHLHDPLPLQGEPFSSPF